MLVEMKNLVIRDENLKNIHWQSTGHKDKWRPPQSAWDTELLSSQEAVRTGALRRWWQRSLSLSAAAAESLQSCPTLCDPTDSSPPGSPVPGILQARTLEWVAISSSNAWKWKVKSESEVAQSCPTLSDPMDCSLPGSSVHGIFQARVLEWGAIAFSVLYLRKDNC